MGRTFRLTLSVKRKKDDKPAHFKVDGARFESQKTVKLNLNTEYELSLTFKPALELHGLTIQGEKVKVTPSTQDETQAVYKAEWTSSGLEQDKKGKRHNIPLLLSLDMGLTAKLTLQAKMYAETEQSHSQWGSQLSHIDYECEVKDGATYVDILKETFR